jgi:epoxide hydrolase-like predicted phosphatase
MAVRGIIFDCFGVLCHGSLDYLRSIAPREHLQELNDLSHASDYGYISSTEYAQKISEIIGRPADEIMKLTRAQRVRSDAMIQLVRSLRPRYKVAMLSNIGRGVINELFTPQELNELFDTVVLSSEVGIVKPNPQVYELVADRLGVLPEECVMIDDLPINVSGAQDVGMSGLVCTSAEQCKTDLQILLEKTSARTT